MFIRLAFAALFLLTFALVQNSAASNISSINSTSKLTTNHTANRTANGTTVDEDIHSCVKKLEKEGAVTKCHKAAEKMWKTTLPPFEWSKTMNGSCLLKENASKAECGGCYEMIICGVRESCHKCSFEESSALENLAKSDVVVIKSKFCKTWPPPATLNIGQLWCPVLINGENATLVIVIFCVLMSLLLLTGGLIICKTKKDESDLAIAIAKRAAHRKTPNTPLTLKAEPRSTSASLKVPCSKLKSSVKSKAKSASSKPKGPITKMKSTVVGGKSGSKSTSNKAKSGGKSSSSKAMSGIKSSISGAKSSAVGGKQASSKSSVNVAPSTVSSKASAMSQSKVTSSAGSAKPKISKRIV